MQMADEERQLDVEGIRERLICYREADREIDLEIERLERLEARLTSAGAQQLSGMPGSPNTPRDRTALLVGQKEEMEQELYEQIREHQQDWAGIERLLSGLRRSDEKEVIRLRYHDRESWGEVQELLFGGNEDYEEHMDLYRRQIFRLHASALRHMAGVESEQRKQGMELKTPAGGPVS